ncbi:hypothetical protein DENIS_2303 [Desulfonema ishimotonii]|uniref:DUF4332 domain-containing protein n=1 Tax=Desulfonema ishimotonii TaxID=45657 RepID=A0A401FWM2_9BACT|nr:hypothetical protein [Desulfonema ishimotonii]GBC61343.1 hypothetical protein DENIS_2303 [Desulfonema ishimotonii]
MTSSLHILPVTNRDIRFERAGEKRLLFLIPEQCRIESADFRVYGQPLPLDIGLSANSSLADIEPPPGNTGEILADSLTIDFHQPRTVCEIQVSVATSVSISHLACVLRAWGGTQWYLPLPVNLLRFAATGSGGAISAKLPALRAEKLLLNFVRLRNPDKTTDYYIDLSDLPVDDLMEIMNFDKTKAVEEGTGVTVSALTLGTADTLSSLTLGPEGKTPLFISPGDFTASLEKPQIIPDPGAALMEAVGETPASDISALDIPEDLKAQLPTGKKYHSVSLMISSATSGILTIQTLSPDYLFHENTLALGEDQPPQESQTLRFRPDTDRNGIPKQSLYAALPRPSTVKKIAFRVSGSLLNEVRIPPDAIWPRPSGMSADMGVQAGDGGKLFSLFKAGIGDRSLRAVEIRGVPLTGQFGLTLSVFKDADGKPDSDADALATSTIAYDESNADQTGSAGKQWFCFDFQEPLFPVEKDTPCWLSLEVAGGKFSWQAETVASDPGVFVFRQDENGTLIPCGPHLADPITLTARFLYLPDGHDGHLTVSAGGSVVGEVALKDVSKIESDFEQAVDIAHSQGAFQIDFISRSEGTIDISHVVLAHEDVSNPLFLVLEEETSDDNGQDEGDIPLRRLLLSAPVEIIDGIGTHYIERLSRIGVSTVSELAALDGQNMVALSEEAGIGPERLGEFISRALAVSSAFPENFPRLPLDHRAEFEAIRRMSADDISKALNVDIAAARTIKETIAILHAVTDASVSEIEIP